jgi:AcrR family transcriptional regulator
VRADAQRNIDALLEAAAAVFATSGVDAPMREIAARAGVGVGTVYRRFPQRPDLIDALFEVRIEELVGYAEEGLEADDPWQGLESFIERAAALLARDRALRQLIFEGHGSAFVDRARDQIKPAVDRMVARAQASGQLRDDIESTDMPLVQMAIVGLNDYLGAEAPEAWRRVLVIVLDGLRASRAGPSKLAVPAVEDAQLERSVTRRGARRT